jgi:hypothetical protein
MLINKVNIQHLLLFYGLFLYSYFGLLVAVYQNYTARYLQVLGIVLFCLAVPFLRCERQKIWKRPIYSIFLLWEIFIVIRMESYSMEALKIQFLDPLNFLTYLIPLIFLAKIDSNVINKWLKMIFFLSIIFWLTHFYMIMKFPVNNFTDLFAISIISSAGLILLLHPYITRFKAIFITSVLCSSMFIGLIYGRRSVALLALFFLLISGWTYFFNVENKKPKRKIFLIVFLACSIPIYLLFEKELNLSSLEIFDRAEVDSRSEVFDAFFSDFELEDYLLGRGIDGSYYHPMKYWNFKNDGFREVNNRTNIENGYLYMLMKGGIIYLFCFLFLAWKSIFLGLFKSNNHLSRALAIYILIYLLDMLTFGQPGFNVKYFLVWMSITILHKENLRRKSEEEIVIKIK